MTSVASQTSKMLTRDYVLHVGTVFIAVSRQGEAGKIRKVFCVTISQKWNMNSDCRYCQMGVFKVSKKGRVEHFWSIRARYSTRYSPFHVLFWKDTTSRFTSVWSPLGYCIVTIFSL